MKPLDHFVRKYKGLEDRHTICQPCNLIERDKWLASLPPERQQAYYRKVAEAGKRYRKQRTERDRRERKDRVDLLCSLVASLRARGWSNRQIAEATRLDRTTINRLARPDHYEIRYIKEHVFERIVALAQANPPRGKEEDDDNSN